MVLASTSRMVGVIKRVVPGTRYSVTAPYVEFRTHPRTSADPGSIVADAVRFRQLSFFRRVFPAKSPKETFFTARTNRTDHDLCVYLLADHLVLHPLL